MFLLAGKILYVVKCLKLPRAKEQVIAVMGHLREIAMLASFARDS